MRLGPWCLRLLATAVLLGCLVAGSGDAQGGKGVIQARARVVNRVVAEDLDRARSDFRERLQQQLRTQRGAWTHALQAQDAGIRASRELGGGRLRVRLDGESHRAQMTVEYLAN